MMSRFKKLLCLILCCAMVLSNVPLARAEEAQAEKAYDIYPVVRQIAYDGTEFRLEEQVNVVYESGIDEATKAYLTEVLEENGITAAVTAEPAEGEFWRGQYEDVIPGYYMNKVHWNSVRPTGTVPDDILRDMLDKSYALVLAGFSKKRQREILGCA